MLEQEGWGSFNARHYDLAIERFDEVLGREPSSEGAHQGRVAALRKKRRFTEASEALDKGLAFHPRSIGLLSERAWLQYEQGRYPEAIQAFDEVLKVDPESDDKIVWKTSLLRALHRYEEAEITLRQARDRMPESVALQTELGWLYFDQRKYEDAADVFIAVLARSKNHELALQGRIASARMTGRVGEAQRLLRAALHEHGRSPGIRSEEGWLYFGQEQYERAEESFRFVLQLQPHDVFSLITLAWTLAWQGGDDELEEAAALCRQALEIDPDVSQAYGCLGVVAFKQGMLREAEANLVRSIRLDPIKGRMADLGALYTQMGRYEEAEKSLRQAIETNPDDAYARVELGNLLLVTDRVKEATRELRFAMAVDGNHADPPRALAIALLESGKPSEAEKIVRNALRVLDQPRRWQLHLTLCQVLTRRGDETGDATLYQDALKEAKAAIRLKGTRPDPYFHAAIVRYKLGDYSGALKDFQRCIKLDKRHVEADLNARRLQTLLRREAHSRIGRIESYVLGGIFLALVLAVWIVFLRTTKLSQDSMMIITPILLTLILASMLLPWLSRLKLAGLEAELSEPQPKETLGAGPKGEIGFDTTLASMAGR